MLPIADPAALLRALGPLDRCMVVLDFDGTLSPIVAHHAEATLPPGAGAALDRLARVARVVISSGRDVDDLQARVGDRDVVFVGGHGARIVHRGRLMVELVDEDSMTALLDTVEHDLLPAIDGHEGWVIERKPTSIAVHHRAATDRGPLADVRRVLQGHADASGDAEVLEGRAVVELRSAASNKGRALTWLLDAFDGPKTLAIGDDVTDEDMFRVARDRGGVGVLVGTPRQTAASFVLADPAAVIDLLDGLVRADRSAEEH
ncbi:MAG: trehalose-phosphatase [Nitriliruptoraceae bacterium]